jgi:hypothetical protein
MKTLFVVILLTTLSVAAPAEDANTAPFLHTGKQYLLSIPENARIAFHGGVATILKGPVAGWIEIEYFPTIVTPANNPPPSPEAIAKIQLWLNLNYVVSVRELPFKEEKAAPRQGNK